MINLLYACCPMLRFSQICFKVCLFLSLSLPLSSKLSTYILYIPDNGPEDEGLVTQENLPYLMQCPVAVSEMDIVSPALVAAAIWTWAPGYSC